MQFNTESFYREIPKPWGREILLTPEGLDRAGKLLFIQAGKRLSLQYHETKEETLCLYSGHAVLHLEDSLGKLEAVPMQALQGYTIVPGQKHRLEAVTDCVVFEVSSAEGSGTTVRVEDDYGRPDETPDLRQDKNRGWHG